MKHSIAEFNRSGSSQKWSEILDIKWLKIKHRKGNGLKKKKESRWPMGIQKWSSMFVIRLLEGESLNIIHSGIQNFSEYQAK